MSFTLTVGTLHIPPRKIATAVLTLVATQGYERIGVNPVVTDEHGNRVSILELQALALGERRGVVRKDVPTASQVRAVT